MNQDDNHVLSSERIRLYLLGTEQPQELENLLFKDVNGRKFLAGRIPAGLDNSGKVAAVAWDQVSHYIVLQAAE